MITATEFGFAYPAQPERALRSIDLTIRAGEVTWLTGALGSGTSTFLLAAAGLAPRLTGGTRHGSILVDGVDPASRSPIVAGIAYLSASPALQLSGIARTVADEVAVGPMNLGQPLATIRQACDEAMARFNVLHLAARPPARLSGGETQRVMLAALHASAPSTWLLDEPFSALDHEARVAVAEVIRAMARSGATVVVASDDADTMLPIADRMVVFADGRCVLDGTPSAVLRSDALHQSGAGSTDAAELAREAGIREPRPLTAGELIDAIPPATDAAVAPVADRTTATVVAEPVLNARGVSFRYLDGPQVLDGADLMVRRGEALGIFGANGAGKSTLLRLAMALEHPQHGDIVVLGTSTRGRNPEDLAPRVGFLFQQPERQLFATSVRAECGFGAKLAGWADERIDAETQRVTRALGLHDVLDEHPGDLPLPRRRLVAMASLLVTDPDLLLLDEPTAGLDAESRRRAVDAVRDRTSRGRTTVAVTHDHVFAHEALDRAVIVDQQRVRDVPDVRSVLDGIQLPIPAALAVARVLAIPASQDRNHQVALVIATRLRR